MKLNWLYSKETEKEIYQVLQLAEEHGRVKVHEYRNFTDYDIIPMVRKLIEKNLEKIKED